MALAALAENALMPLAEEAPSASAHSAHTQPSWLPYVYDRLAQLMNLPPGWDGYGGEPVPVDIASFAAQLLIETLDPEGPCPQIVPLSYGGVQIEWHELTLDLEIEVVAPHEIIVSYEDATTGDEDEFRLSTDVYRLAALLGELTTRAN